MSEIYLYIYDISGGLARSMSLFLIGKQLEGIWHTAIVAWGREYFFGGDGIGFCNPCGTILGAPTERVSLGLPIHSKEELYNKLEEWSQGRFRGDRYHLLNHNCNTFSAELSKWLTGRSIPSKITNLPSDVLNSPLGPFIREMLDGQRVSGPNASRENLVHPGFFDTNYNSSSTVTTDTASSSTGRSSATVVDTQHNAAVSRITNSPSACALFDEPLTLATKAASVDSTHLLSEVIEFCSLPVQQPVEWSLGPYHLTLLDAVQMEGTVMEDTLQLAVLDSLRLAVCREPQLLRMDRGCKLGSLVQRVSPGDMKFAAAAARLVCNCLLIPEPLPPTERLPAQKHLVELTLKLLQCDDDSSSETHKIGACLARNVSSWPLLGYDEHLELGSYLIEMLLTMSVEVGDCKWQQYLLASLRNNMHHCADLIDLAVALELDLTSFCEHYSDARDIQNILAS